MAREIDQISQEESMMGRKPLQMGKVKEKIERDEIVMNFTIDGKTFHTDLYKELMIDANSSTEMNEIAGSSCSDAVFWGIISRKIKTKAITFKTIDVAKWESHTKKWARLMCIGEGSKATAADMEAKKTEAFSGDLIPEDKSDEALKKSVDYFVRSAIIGYHFKTRDFESAPITSAEIDQYFRIIYKDTYDIVECNYEVMNEYLIKLEEQSDILELITKLMSDKRTTLISTISNNIRSEQNLFGKENYKEAISQFNSELLKSNEFKEIVKKAIKEVF